MPINWGEFNKDLDSIIKKSADKTDTRLASKISSITRMTDEEVKELFPKPADIQKLAKLMQIVKSSEDRNTKVNNIMNNTEEFAGIILTLLEKFS